jgi:acyl-homoserine-lactone acylase
MMRHFYILIFLYVGWACTKPTASESQRWERHVSNTTIIRDDFGIPHIYGKSDADAVFGMLYAQCEDDFKRVERNYLWAIGRLAEVEGEALLYSDLRARLYMTEHEARALYEEAPDHLKALCQAFADGINYYLHTHPEVQPRLLTRFEPWMPLYFSEGSIGGDIERISLRRLQEFYENDPLVAMEPHYQDVPWRVQEPQGSNGIAISGKLTASGHPMLLINPHTSFYFRPEVHVVSEEGLNAYGAVTWGQFFIYQGFNAHNGWMHTSSYADVIDEFVEKVQEMEGKYTYQYGEERKEIEERQVTLAYQQGDSLALRTFTVYRTHHGPITHRIEEGWVATALMWKPVEALQQAFIRSKTTNFKEFRQMMEWRTNSSNNTVYADKDGNIAYYHGNFMPRRDEQFDYSRPVDGSNPATDWQGLHEVSELIQVINPPNGWIQNCNSTPFTAALEYSPKKEHYPAYMATEPENFRGVHAIQVLTGRSGYTLDKLIDTAYDPYLPAFEKLIPGLVEAYDVSGRNYGRLRGPINVLRQWDMRVSKESVAMSLAHYYISLYLQKGPRPDGLSMMDRVHYFGTETPHSQRLELFVEVIDKLEADFGSWNTPWGEISRLQRLDGAIDLTFDDAQPSLPVGMASGNWGALASFGARGNTGTKRIYGTYGNSFVAVVEFGERVKAKSLLAGGQNGDPNSPHFFDQGQAYADGVFKEVAFYREEVEKRAKETYKPGQRTGN